MTDVRYFAVANSHGRIVGRFTSRTVAQWWALIHRGDVIPIR